MRSVPLGRVAGIQVRLHPTFLLLVVLVVLAGTTDEGPGAAAELGWLALVFACVLFHELAHSVVARRRGMRVQGITLLPIGGVSSIEALPEHPRDELVVAAAGPLSSLGLAVGFGLVTALTGGALFPPALTVGGLGARMAWFNLVLAGFNLLPAFPMDGGRVLRAWLERRMSLVDATTRAASTGRTAALLMGAAGLLWNPWLVLIAVFVYLGATAEQQATLVHARLAGLLVGDAMVTEITAVPSQLPVREVRELLRHAGQREIPLLVREGTFGGMVDGLWVAQYGEDDLPVGTYADTSAPAVAVDLALEDAVVELSRRRQPAAAVVDAHRHVLGVVRADDIRRLLAPAARQRPTSRR